MTDRTPHSESAPPPGSTSVRTASIGAESAYRLTHVADDDLLAGTRRLIGRSNQVLAELLAHLAEVEARGIHRRRACASLFMYCVFELRLSEDAAFRRARAARVARQFPVIFQHVADGELHLTAIVLLAPHLTEENHRELLLLAKHRTKREILRLVRTLAPEPSVPDRVEPLGPEYSIGSEHVGIPMPRAATWRNLVESRAPAVRELSPGDRPKDWIEHTNAFSDRDATSSEREPQSDASAARAAMAPMNVERHSATLPQRYKVTFTASQEYSDLLERAQDLLSHAVPDRSLEEVHVRALRLLVKRLETRKYGAPRRAPTKITGAAAPSEGAPSDTAPSEAAPAPVDAAPSKAAAEPLPPESKNHTHAPRQRDLRRRQGNARVRREVRDRDGCRCTYVDEFGQRCRETRFLEFHHELAYALDGDPGVDNLTLRCQAHNALAAEQDFGRAFMEARVQSNRRDPPKRDPPSP